MVTFIRMYLARSVSGLYFYAAIVGLAIGGLAPAVARVSLAPNVSVTAVSANPSTAFAGDAMTFVTTVSAAVALDNAIVDFEVYDAAWRHVHQIYRRGIALAANRPQTVSVSWVAPDVQSSSSYHLQINVLDSAWLVIAQNNSAGFIVQPALVAIEATTVSPARVISGQKETLEATVASNVTLSHRIIDFEVYDAAGTRIYQTWRPSPILRGGRAQSFTVTWAVPAAQSGGDYRLKAGVFSSDWSVTSAWTDVGTTFAVVRPIAMGVYLPQSPWDRGRSLTAFEKMIGHKMAIDMWYEDWPSTGFSAANFNAVAGRGEMPMLSWNPCNRGHTVGGNPCDFQLIVGGVADGYLHAWARAAAAWGKPLYLRFAWEMNTSDRTHTGSGFVAMWRHVHDIFAQERATNVRWFWCPNALGGNGGIPLSDLYPGDAYVDDVGFDAYNFGPIEPWYGWSSLYDDYQRTYDALVALTNKPIIVGETSSTEIGGSKANWLSQGFLSVLPVDFPRIRAIIWFDGCCTPDWRVNSSPSALAAYRQIMASPFYHGRLG